MVNLCRKCGIPIREGALLCIKCESEGEKITLHKRPEEIREPLEKKKEPILAALLSFILPGAGQVYNGEIGKGILMFFLVVLLCVVPIFTCVCPIILCPIVYIYNIYDAYASANRINRGW